MVKPVSERYRAALRGVHRVAARATLVDASPQFSLSPTGEEIPILDGAVDLSDTAAASATLTTSAQWWDRVRPYGTEIFIERGVLTDPWTAEMLPLGYFRVEQVDQASAPNGPIRLTLSDRTAQLQQNLVTFPAWINAGTSHRQIFELLVNGGVTEGQTLYGAYHPGGSVPIIWQAYDPDAVMIETDQLVTDSTYDVLKDLVSAQGARLTWDSLGRLVVAPTVARGAQVARIVGGPGGTLVRASRSVTRKGINNIITAYGSDPMAPTSFVVSFAESGPLQWDKATYPAFGPAPRFYDSPALTDDGAVAAAADALLEAAQRLPETLTLSVVADASIEPLDVVSVRWGPDAGELRRAVQTVTIPLVAGPATLATRPLTPREEVS